MRTLNSFLVDLEHFISLFCFTGILLALFIEQYLCYIWIFRSVNQIIFQILSKFKQNDDSRGNRS